MDIDLTVAGENIRKRLKELGMRQSDLAKELGVSRAYVNLVVNGKLAFKPKRTMELLSILRMTDVPGFFASLFDTRYERGSLPREEAWIVANKYVPHFDKEGIRALNGFLDKNRKYTFWGGPNSDLELAALIFKERRKGQVSFIKGPSWLDCLSCKIYDPLSSSDTEHIDTKDNYYAGTRRMDNSLSQLICKNLIPPYLQLKNGQKVGDFELV